MEALPFEQFQQQEIRKPRIERNLIFPKITDFDFKVLECVYNCKIASAAGVCDKLELLPLYNHLPLVKEILDKYEHIQVLQKEIRERVQFYQFNKKSGFDMRKVVLKGKGFVITRKAQNIGIVIFDLTSLEKR